jgi:hypothetical protein
VSCEWGRGAGFATSPDPDWVCNVQTAGSAGRCTRGQGAISSGRRGEYPVGGLDQRGTVFALDPGCELAKATSCQRWSARRSRALAPWDSQLSVYRCVRKPGRRSDRCCGSPSVNSRSGP